IIFLFSLYIFLFFFFFFFFFSSRRRHTRLQGDWSSDVCSSDLVVKRLADDIQWTTDLGNAFLAQQSDVLDAVQRMRKKAQDTGNLKSTEQQKVETKVIESKSVIVVEQANPQVVYVPSYDPVVVW